MEIDFSIITPLYKENDLETLCQHLLSVTHNYNIEIIFVDAADDPSNMSVLSYPFKKILAPQGRARQMNAGARIAKGNILCFLHADTRLPPNALSAITTAMKMDTNRVGGAFQLQFHTHKKYFKFLAACANLRTAITRVPFGDQAIFIRAAIFKQLDGYDDIPLMEDIALMKKIKKLGYKICLIPYPVLTSIRRWQNNGLIRITLVNLKLQLLYKCGYSINKIARAYCNNRFEE